MNGPHSIPESLWPLIDAAFDGSLTPRQGEELQTLLETSREACEVYGRCARIEAELYLLARRRASQSAVAREVARKVAVVQPAADFPVSSMPGASSPALGLLGNAWQGTTSYLSSHEFFTGYVVATVLFSVAALIAANLYVGQNQNQKQGFVQSDPQLAPKTIQRVPEPKIVSIARITGTVDCVWVDTKDAPFHDRVVQGTKFMLKSGLMEITYHTGAKVILQGPCTYEVESTAGGYLSLGKLTARVESRSRLPDGTSRSRLPSEILTTDSNTSKSRPAGGTYFAVRTPTAVVTDLGTEFGVEVNGEGVTRSHVYRGKVELVALDALGEEKGRKLALNANESGCVEKNSDGGTNQAAIVRAGDVAAKEFIRHMPNSPEGREEASRAYADFVLSLKPAVYYRMERPEQGENTMQVVDSAPGGHHGKAYSNSAAWIDKDTPTQIYKPGRFGEAMLFRGEWGQEHVIVPDYPKAENDQLTVSVWVLTASRQTYDYAVIAANWGDSVEKIVAGQFFISLARPDGGLRVVVRQHDGELVEVHEPVPEGFPTHHWQHVALVADGVMLRLYRNGKEVGASPCQGVLPKPPITSLGIGGETDATGTAISPNYPRCWQGQIDELAVFNRALSLEEIKKLAKEDGKQKRRQGI